MASTHSSKTRRRTPAAAAPTGTVLDDLYLRPGFLVRRMAQLLMSIAEQETAKIGLTPPQHVCLIALARTGGLDQISLGKALGMDRATVGQVVRRLESRGLVERTSVPGDARRKVVLLTLAGRELAVTADDAALNVSRRLMEPLAGPERLQLTQLMTRVVESLNPQSVVPIEPPRR
jgi:DNA-binding MarR family transcriptional regulator